MKNPPPEETNTVGPKEENGDGRKRGEPKKTKRGPKKKRGDPKKKKGDPKKK
ncbi:MAG TPA: hypothetical protein VEV41_20175 [Terriglobales bacterium]|nr:hypothetical protein [Terriglobales bacterium]